MPVKKRGEIPAFLLNKKINIPIDKIKKIFKKLDISRQPEKDSLRYRIMQQHNVALNRKLKPTLPERGNAMNKLMTAMIATVVMMGSAMAQTPAATATTAAKAETAKVAAKAETKVAEVKADAKAAAPVAPAAPAAPASASAKADVKPAAAPAATDTKTADVKTEAKPKKVKKAKKHTEGGTEVKPEVKTEAAKPAATK